MVFKIIIMWIPNLILFILGMTVFMAVGLLAFNAIWKLARHLLRKRENRQFKKIYDDYLLNGEI